MYYPFFNMMKFYKTYRRIKFKQILVLIIVLLSVSISGCGTVERFTEYKLVVGTNEHGEPLNYYHPYKPYFRAIKADNDYLTLCWTIIACPVVLVDYPISLVTDLVMFPVDLSRDMYIQHYNDKHITQEQYGTFTIKSQALYGYKLPYSTIYYKNQQTPIKLPTGYNLKIVEKKLNPTTKLLVETVKGHLFLIEDKDNQAVVSRVGNNHNRFVSLPDFPELRFFYRPIEDDSCFRAYCGFAFRRWSLPQPCESSVDIRNYSFTIAIDKQLNKFTWGSHVIADIQQEIHPNQTGNFPLHTQAYILTISPDKEQAVYLVEDGSVWVVNSVTKQIKSVLLSKQQLTTLIRLKDYFSDEVIEVGDSKNNYLENRIALYKAYINWINDNFKWRKKTGYWQLVNQ